MYAFHLRPRGSNGTVAVRLIVVVWPVRSMHRAAVLVLLAGETSLSGSPVWRALKLRTYQLAVCSTLTHASEAWTLTEPVMRSVNGFNSRCLHIITSQDYRVTATAPEYDLLLAIRQRRLRYLGHILRMPESRVVRRALVALAKGGSVYPKGSLFMDCQLFQLLCRRMVITYNVTPRLLIIVEKAQFIGIARNN